MHCTLAGERLRAEGVLASGLVAHMQTSMHDPEAPYFYASAAARLPVPTNITSELINAAGLGLDKCYEPGHGFMKGGVMLYDLAEEDGRQLTLMEACTTPQNGRQRALMQAMDAVNDKYGRGTMRYLAQGSKDAFWHMQRKLLSPYLPNSWEQLPRIATG